VRSTPTHAPVIVNGTWRGRTPLTLEDLPYGRYTIRVAQPGFRPAVDQFTLGAHEAAHTFNTRLEAVPAAPTPPAASRPGVPAPQTPGSFVGGLFIDSRPQGASVLLDGHAVGQTPLRLSEVPVGTHIVRLELVGKRPWSSSTRVVSGEIARVTGSLDDQEPEAAARRTSRGLHASGASR
jgi:hypothetical protein